MTLSPAHSVRLPQPPVCHNSIPTKSSFSSIANKPEGYANARDVRNYLEKAISNQASRIVGLKDVDKNILAMLEKVIRDMNKLGRYDLQMFYMRNMNTYLNANSKHK